LTAITIRNVSKTKSMDMTFSRRGVVRLQAPLPLEVMHVGY
jgi:hypothetical protein